MRIFTFKRQLMFVMFMLLGCLAIHAEDENLITQQITIKLDQAGTLPDKIGDNKKYKITNLKIVGEINGTDLKFIRDMAGMNVSSVKTNGQLSILDLSETKIVKGGDYYSYRIYYGVGYPASGEVVYFYTDDDRLGDYAFFDCNSLTDIKLPSSLNAIGDYTFEFCGSLEKVNIPFGVFSIGDYAFFRCRRLINIEIPASVNAVGASTFEDCSALAKVSFPSSVSFLGGSTFAGCPNLTDFCFQITDNIDSYLEKGHPYIGITNIKYIFNEQEITSLVIPASVSKLGDYSLQNCNNLRSVYVSWNAPISAGCAFEGIDLNKCTLYVPQGAKQDYWLADVWGDFNNIVEYDATGIDDVTTSSDAKEVSRYSVNGQRLSAPTKGLNIVKYSDGSVKKVAVQ